MEKKKKRITGYSCWSVSVANREEYLITMMYSHIRGVSVIDCLDTQSGH